MVSRNEPPRQTMTWKRRGSQTIKGILVLLCTVRVFYSTGNLPLLGNNHPLSSNNTRLSGLYPENKRSDPINLPSGLPDAVTARNISTPPDDNPPWKENLALCLLNETKHFVHFPHTAEQLFPCWSFFREHSTKKCAFWLTTDTSRPEGMRPGWSPHVIEAMNCTFYRSREPPTLGPTSVKMHAGKRVRVFFANESDARTLSRRVLQYYKDLLPPPLSPHPSLQHSIAVVQRNKSRSLGNIEEIQKEIQRRFPESMFVVASMEDLNHTVHQAHFWNSHDVIITPHGAAMTNAIFMRPNAAVVEVYPFEYAPAIFIELCRKSGIQHFRYDTTVEETLPYRSPTQTCPCGKFVTLQPNVSALMDVVAQAVAFTSAKSRTF